MYNSPFLAPKPRPSSSGITCFHPDARPLFERALLIGQLRGFVARLTRRSRQLKSLQDRNDFSYGIWQNRGHIQPVSLNQIRGSVNRCCEFDCDFYPLDEQLESRWVRVASMILQHWTLPPVELIQVGNIFYVVDGHHRISVARMLGHSTLDAVMMGGG